MRTYKMPAEWETHERTIMQFPVFQNKCNLELVRQNYAEVASAIAQFEPVTMIVNGGEEAEIAKKLLPSEVELLELPHDDGWARDNQPSFVYDDSGTVTAIDWQFNAWGRKYPHWELDNALPTLLCDNLGIPRVEAQLILEGGSVHTNGAGALISTSECLLNTNRNFGVTQATIESELKRYFGANRVVWLTYGLINDETDGHVDNVCCFIDEDTVLLYGGADTRINANKLILRRNGINVISMPVPQGITIPAASYINFYFVNGGIILPAFGVPSDEQALGLMKELFPERKVVQINSRNILLDGGNIHCITKQIPIRKS